MDLLVLAAASTKWNMRMVSNLAIFYAGDLNVLMMKEPPIGGKRDEVHCSIMFKNFGYEMSSVFSD